MDLKYFTIKEANSTLPLVNSICLDAMKYWEKLKEVDSKLNVLLTKTLNGGEKDKDIVEKLGGSKLEFQVPEDMKNYSIAGIMEKYKDEKTGTVNLSKLSESDREAYMFYENFLSTSYKKACEATAASKGNYFAELNAQAKQQLGKKYELKEKKE